jgi:hypothetical protein
MMHSAVGNANLLPLNGSGWLKEANRQILKGVPTAKGPKSQKEAFFVHFHFKIPALLDSKGMHLH